LQKVLRLNFFKRLIYMDSLINTLQQLDTKQLKQLTKDFGIKTKSNRKSILISGLLQKGGSETVKQKSLRDDPATIEIGAQDAMAERAEQEEIEAEANAVNDIQFERFEVIGDRFLERFDVLEYISGLLGSGELAVDEETFETIKMIYMTGLGYQNALQLGFIDDENFIEEIENFLDETEDRFQNLKTLYYDR